MKEGARQVSINSRGRSCQVHGGCRPGSCCRLREREREGERENLQIIVLMIDPQLGLALS